MAVTDPCCCRLQLGVTIMAILEIICCVFLIIFQSVSIIDLLGDVAAATDRNDNLAGVGMILVIAKVIDLLIYMVDLIASVYLLIGARTRNMYKCRIWFAWSLFYMGIYLLSEFVQFAQGTFGSTQRTEQAAGVKIIVIIVVILIIGYQLWVVYAFMDELKLEAAQGRPRGVESGVVYYAPKDNTSVDNPPPYGEAAGPLTPYPPASFAAQPLNPGMYPAVPPPEDNIPYKKTTTNY